MADLYYEEMVKKKETGKDKLIRFGLMGLTAVLIVLAILSLNMILILPAIVVCVADIFIFPHLHIEWEYQYVNGELDIDKIMNKQKRKRVKSFETTSAEIIAPVCSHRLDYYNNNTRMKTLDFTSADPERTNLVYAMIITDGNETVKVLFEPTTDMIKDIRLKAPRKVFFD